VGGSSVSINRDTRWRSSGAAEADAPRPSVDAAQASPGSQDTWPQLLQTLEEPAWSNDVGSQGFGPPPQFAIGRDESDRARLVRDGVDKCIVTAAIRVKDGHALDDGDRDALTKLPFENDDDR
jgi:hypothetical protein